MNLNISATSGTKDTLDQLEKVIQKRAEILHETTQQSVTAITIQTIKSLRADARKSKGKVENVSEKATGDMSIQVEEVPQWVVGFKRVGDKKKPCIRNGKKGEVVDVKVWWQVPKDKTRYSAKVFKVTLADSRVQAWKKQKKFAYMVASSLKAAIDISKKRYSKIASRYVGIAKDVWSRAMMLVSDRPASYISTPKSKNVISQNIKVIKKLQANYTASNGNYSVEVEDTLRYATKAQKSGANIVIQAIQKACNSTIGYLNKWMIKNSNGFFDESKKLDLPFPPETD